MKREWHAIDDDIKQEIVATWAAIIEKSADIAARNALCEAAIALGDCVKRWDAMDGKITAEILNERLTLGDALRFAGEAYAKVVAP